MAVQEGAVGGVVDDPALGAAPVVLEQLRVIVAGFEQVPAFPITDLIKCGPALQKDGQVFGALFIGEAELIAAVPIEEAAQPSCTVEVAGREVYLQDTHVGVLNSQEPFRVYHCAVFATVNFQLARRVEKRQVHFVAIHLPTKLHHIIGCAPVWM